MKKFFHKIFKFLLKLFLGFLILSILSVILFRFVPVPFTPLMLIRCVEQITEGKELRLKKDWVSFDKIPNNLQLAVVCSEDQNFLKHNGFDFEAIEKAMKHNEKHKKKRGASTISQQTAKNVFLWPGRSWIRKGLEVYFTFLIELCWNKQRIMEVYLNIIEMGDGVYGAQATAKYFFKKDAHKLSRTESALIAAVLPNPRKFSIKAPSGYVRGRQNFVLEQMSLWGGILRYQEVGTK
ncbi:MAG: monofunctional biosynthetic peptidoglycan transglycosylase [Bacteroidetes bacterium]|nr:monofunctional biosynthetic peptidoglycan transglycosylase [Bacteroidota bacterium]